MARPNVVPRSHIRSLTEIEVHGSVVDLGDHRDFRRHAILDAFMPDHGRVSISWTRLAPSGRLQDHTHPTSSMIIICRGRANLTGDLRSALVEGDVVTIPAGCRHGFTANSDDGFEALSIQFDGEGLYENQPLVSLTSPLDLLIAANDRRLESHLATPFYGMLSPELFKSEAKLARFEQCLKYWSAQFQRILHARSTFSTDPRFSPVFRGHLREELDHDLLLKAEGDLFWDPVIASCSEWFVSRMYSSSDLERLAIVHLVLESSGHEFYERVMRIDELKSSLNADYYISHERLDQDHASCGHDLLSGLTSGESDQLRSTIAKSWDVLDALFSRVVTIVELT